MRYLFWLFLLAACGSNKSKPPSDLDQQIEDKAAFYLSNADLDSQHWPRDTKCDGLLFASLYSISGGPSDPMLAFDGERWHRHHEKDCYPNGSASSISRDMFDGLFLWVWKNKRRDVIEQVIQYGEEHTNALGGWVMGEGDPFRVSIRGSGQALAYEMRWRMGGADHAKRHLPQVYTEVTGYEAHLQALSILLIGLMRGGISDLELKVLKRSSEREPRNALFSALYHEYSDGDRMPAARILLDSALFPTDRLPSSADRCEMYLWQRDDGADYRPCPERKLVHSGIDFLIAKAILFREL